MTKKEYLNHKARLKFEEAFQEVIFKFREETGLMIVRATDHDLDEESIFAEVPFRDLLSRLKNSRSRLTTL